MPTGIYTRKPNPVPIIDRFLAHLTESPNGCLLWTGPRTAAGYGTFTCSELNPKQVLAHRWFYEYKKGPILEGLQLDHLCRVRNCVNPDHLEPVTQRENILRGEGVSALAAKKTHCPSGHPYDLSNTRITSKGHRLCRECNKTYSRKIWEVRKKKVNEKRRVKNGAS